MFDEQIRAVPLATSAIHSQIIHCKTLTYLCETSYPFANAADTGVERPGRIEPFKKKQPLETNSEGNCEHSPQ